jgi:hypothetical protein
LKEEAVGAGGVTRGGGDGRRAWDGERVDGRVAHGDNGDAVAHLDGDRAFFVGLWSHRGRFAVRITAARRALEYVERDWVRLIILQGAGVTRCRSECWLAWVAHARESEM